MSVVLDQEGIDIALRNMANQLKSVVAGQQIAFIGLRSRGDEVAERLVTLLAEDDTAELLLGVLDISLYRDDLSQLTKNPSLQSTEIDFPLDDTHVVLVDDVLYTGRTVRAALDALTDFGRPSKIELAVLLDRGHRDLPIQPNYVGHVLGTDRSDHVKVYLENKDGRDLVELTPAAETTKKPST